MDKPTVFISYSHKDEAWKDRLRPHLKMFEQLGHLALWDDRSIDGGAAWYDEIREAMERASVAICLISADFLASDFCVKEEIPYLLQRCEKEGMSLIPVLVRPCGWKKVPWLEQLQMLPRDGRSVAVDHPESYDTVFADVGELVLKCIEQASFQPASPQPAWPALAVDFIEIDHLPPTGFELFGRQKEIRLLDETWETGRPNVISLVAYGGVGKSTLVNKWLDRLAADNYRGAKRVYGWSFYSQGTKQQATSADFFFNEALQWFGEKDPTRLSPWDKGERLAALLRKQKTLLILDGLEPLQSGFDFERGKIRDPGLDLLVSRLAQEMDGLCIITTREKITGQQAESVVQCDLEQISPKAARALLRVRGVRGTDQELEEASRQFGPHALAINLLASYLQGIPGHPIAAAYEIPDLDIPVEQGRHPRRVIAAFEQRLGESELELLRILGLFDRPAKAAEIQAIMADPPILGLTDELKDVDRETAVETLRECRLIARKSVHRPNDWDAHPLVREHFADQLQKHYSDAWEEGHRRLYKHFEQTAKKFPETLDEMMPLYQAVAHGCRARLHQQALDEVYWARIARKTGAFAVKKLGAFGADLAAVSSFFERPWDRPSGNLTPEDQSFLLSQAGFRLHALGRLSEATEPMRAALEAGIKQEDWKNSAIRTGNLSELRLTLGDLPQAVEDARRSVELADRSGDAYEKLKQRAKLADALHQSGDLAQARSLFQEAERMQKESQPQYPLFYSVRGFHYCDLLLGECESPAWHPQASPGPSRPQALSRCRQVRRRAEEAMKIVLNGSRNLLDIALNHLTLGRTFLLEAALDAPSSPIPPPQPRPPAPSLQTEALTQSRHHLDRAVTGLRQAGQQQYQPLGFIARAQLHRFQRNFDEARQDLAEASQISSRGPMTP